MFIVLIIATVFIITVFLYALIEYFIINYTEEEKQEVWKNVYKQIEDNKNLF
jgi:hypothetical protein